MTVLMFFMRVTSHCINSCVKLCSDVLDLGSDARMDSAAARLRPIRTICALPFE